MQTVVVRQKKVLLTAPIVRIRAPSVPEKFLAALLTVNRVGANRQYVIHLFHIVLNASTIVVLVAMASAAILRGPVLRLKIKVIPVLQLKRTKIVPAIVLVAETEFAQPNIVKHYQRARKIALLK